MDKDTMMVEEIESMKNRYNDYCSTSLNDDIGCGAYKIRYAVGWNAAGALYGGQDNSRDYEEPGEYYNDFDNDDE